MVEKLTNKVWVGLRGLGLGDLALKRTLFQGGREPFHQQRGQVRGGHRDQRLELAQVDLQSQSRHSESERLHQRLEFHQQRALRPHELPKVRLAQDFDFGNLILIINS